jgi:hypothetical protein
MSRAGYKPWEILEKLAITNCKKHKATQSLEVKIRRKLPASNGVEN